MADTHRLKSFIAPALVAACAIVHAACAAAPARTAPEPAPPGAVKPAAPWSATRISSSDVPAVYAQVWRTAGNRSQCALLAPAQLSPETRTAAIPRSATFSGGWAVAYDMPGLRSAFGVAGAATDPWAPDVYDEWPHKITWADGSSAGYGLETGSASKWLAYVKIPGQRCLYNIWSSRGRAHLEQLLSSLRYVNLP